MSRPTMTMAQRRALCRRVREAEERAAASETTERAIDRHFPAKGKSHVVGRASVGTGEFAHAWAHELRQVVFDADVEVDDPGTAHGRRLVLELGARIRRGSGVVDEAAKAEALRRAAP